MKNSKRLQRKEKKRTVGQEVQKILSKDQPEITAGEILEESASSFMKELFSVVEANKHSYESPFYVFVFTHKEFWAVNVVRNWFVARQTPPFATDMISQYPHHAKTLYKVNYHNGTIDPVWNIPGIEDCRSILKNPSFYNPVLVEWIQKAFKGELDQKEYTEKFL